ncbi:MAG: hypothetical protein M3R38_29960 [Actinomycetota bacterium]|nr:hypothetical protein [Actinomycetota bacterium]
MSEAILKTVLSLCLPCLMLVAACDTSPTAQQGGGHTGAETTGPVTASSTVPGVFFPEQRPGGADMMSETRGELILDDEGCLRVRYRGGSSVILWPAGFRPDEAGGEVRVLDGRGRVVARVGEGVYMAGGGAPSPERLDEVVEERTARQLRERCPGAYWVAAPPVRAIRRG